MIRFILRAFFRAVICMLILFFMWVAGFSWFVSQVPRAPSKEHVKTDAIVVLTGGAGRINYGLELLNRGLARRLFITGMESKMSAHELIAKYQPGMEGSVEDEQGRKIIMLGYDARNTIGNAIETAQWIRSEDIKSIRLVTASYHMPRALAEFRYAMPGVIMLPDAVVPDGFRINEWWHWESYTSTILLSEFHKLMAARLRHWMIAATEEQQ